MTEEEKKKKTERKSEAQLAVIAGCFTREMYAPFQGQTRCRTLKQRGQLSDYLRLQRSFVLGLKMDRCRGALYDVE